MSTISAPTISGSLATTRGAGQVLTSSIPYLGLPTNP